MKQYEFDLPAPIFKKGYGIIPKAVMIDSRLSIGAKALYALFVSDSGWKDSEYVKKSAICKVLRISRNTLDKYFAELLESGFLIPEVEMINGKENAYVVFATDIPGEKP